MSATPHTPGPWGVADTSIVSESHCIAVIEDDGGYEAPPDQQEANARLMAASPDLLEAAKGVRFLLKSNGLRHSVEYADIEAAIAKAEASK